MGDFITLSIHTSQYALTLKRLLESHNIEVKLQKFLVADAPIPVGLSIMIHEKDLPLALKIIESAEHLSTLASDKALSANREVLLIPVDFNDFSINACKAGFEIAQHLNLQPVVLHAYPSPVFNPSFSMDDISIMGEDNSLEEELNEIEISKDIRKNSHLKMKDFVHKVKKAQNDGIIPQIEFKTILEDGIAEDVIKDYCRATPPALVVMVTRGKQKKGEQLIGSVTAEVLDDCRVPVLSIPENNDFCSIKKIKEIVFFCNMDQHDLMSVDTFMRMFEYPVVNITLIPLYEKPDKDLQTKLLQLKDYFSKTYPTANFTTAIFPSKTFMLDFDNYESQRGTEMIVVPNRRRNAIMRLFNPGIAHRLLFERDLPLLAIPI